ncbi:unnamed protein product [Porites lobata]|uniref:Uncharacterized protein n=1 Tax=Porites lobata TaxID=104759 RepID=A0ABN8P5T4_9CNID|nr:unnamed protein product [Porites lobata]
MLRDPPAQLESVFNYYDIYRKTFQPQSSPMTPLESFFQNITFYRSSRVLDGLGVDLNLLKNPSLFDLGLDREYHENLTLVQDYIRFLQQEFDLVMLMEYFDESLVLLKRQLCWKMEDILFFKLNERVQKEKQRISNQVREQIKKWNSADVLLYDVFNQTLWQKIMKEGPDFFEDLSIFKKEKEAMKNKCLRKGKFLTKLWAWKKVQGYKLKTNISKELNTTCTKMTMNELKYLSYLQTKLTKQLQDVDDNRIKSTASIIFCFPSTVKVIISILDIRFIVHIYPIFTFQVLIHMTDLSMDYIDTTDKLLKSLNGLLSALTRQINGGEDTFLHQASQFVQFAITTLEKQDPTLKKQINKGIDFIVSSIASLVTKVVSSGAIYNATVFVSQEIGEFFNDGSIPKIMRNKYDELVRRLATALERKTNIEDLCSKLLGEVAFLEDNQMVLSFLLYMFHLVARISLPQLPH